MTAIIASMGTAGVVIGIGLAAYGLYHMGKDAYGVATGKEAFTGKKLNSYQRAEMAGELVGGLLGAGVGTKLYRKIGKVKTGNTPKEEQKINVLERTTEFDKYEENQGFTVVWDEATGEILHRPSSEGAAPIRLKDGTIEFKNVVLKNGGHDAVNKEMGPASMKRAGLALIKLNDQTMKVTWNSNQLNPKNFGLTDPDRAVPAIYRSKIVASLEEKFPGIKFIW